MRMVSGLGEGGGLADDDAMGCELEWLTTSGRGGWRDTLVGDAGWDLIAGDACERGVLFLDVLPFVDLPLGCFWVGAALDGQCLLFLSPRDRG